jgi:hypothetical protein
VAYYLDFPPATKTALRNITGLSRAGRLVLWAGVLDTLRHYADTYRANPALRLAPNSPRFNYQHVFRDPGTGRVHSLRLVVNDASAAYGVLVVEYLDHQAGP